jgi:cytochrome c553
MIKDPALELTQRREMPGMWGPLLLSAVVMLAALTGCTNLDRSREWSNSQVSGAVLAEQVCSTCHGIDGQSSNSLFPKLAGQQKEYILGQLEAIKGRDRNSEHTRQFMWGPARYISAKQMDELATYFSKQPPMRGTVPNGQLSEVGQVIYHQGVPGKGVKACSSCHGDAAQGDDVIPRLAGQHAYYMNNRARIAMTKIVANLSDDEINAISAYLETIGEGGLKPASLPVSKEKFVEAKGSEGPATAKIFDAEGEASNCHYSVWTYGWYCGSFWDALGYHLKNQ